MQGGRKMEFGIGEFSTLTNLSIHTLRYYEKEGMLQVRRDKSGNRRYTEENLQWITFIKDLRETGMSIKEIQEYAQLTFKGPETAERRVEILKKHRRNVIEEKNRWDNCLMQIDMAISANKLEKL